MNPGYFETLYNNYLWTLTFADPRTKGWLLVDSPLPTFFLTGLYLLIVWRGPQIMKNKKPYKLKSALIIYNFAMAILNLYIVKEYVNAAWRLNYTFGCQKCIPTNNDPDELRIVHATWWYYFSKVLEFMDTFFFILRKKNNQLTFLHVYHHSTMFCLWWIGAKWVPSGATYGPATINGSIHVVMYSYYGLAALGLSKYLWWKKYLTILQLVQFGVLFGFAVDAVVNGNCDFPIWMQYFVGIYMVSFLCLFGNFYMNTYKQGTITMRNLQKTDKQEVNNNGIKEHRNEIYLKEVEKKNI